MTSRPWFLGQGHNPRPRWRESLAELFTGSRGLATYDVEVEVDVGDVRTYRVRAESEALAVKRAWARARRDKHAVDMAEERVRAARNHLECWRS